MEYLVVIPIEDMPLGKLYKAGESLPLHTTVLHWFKPGRDFKITSFVQKMT